MADALLLESGSFILLEDGSSHILLETAGPPAAQPSTFDFERSFPTGAQRFFPTLYARLFPRT